MQYKLIAADMDGTLLNGKKEVTPASASAIAECARRGAVFTLASGRPIQGLARYLAHVSGDAPLVTYNGAEVVTARSRRLLYRRDMPPGSAESLIRQGLALGVTVTVWSRGELFLGQPSPESAGYAGKSGVRPQPLRDPAALAARGVTKLLWIAPPAQIDAFTAGFAQEPPEGVRACASERSYLEFMASEVSKANGLALAAEALGIDRQAVLALGDGWNDADMLAWAGLGVAMGNAPAGVRAVADAVTASNEDEGVALALRRFVLGEG